jgi:hypothetical protein
MALKDERLAEVVEVTPIGRLNVPLPKSEKPPSHLDKEEGRMTLRATSGAGFVPADKSPRQGGGRGPAIDMDIQFDEDGEAIAVPIFASGPPVRRQAAQVPQTPVAPQIEPPEYQEEVAGVISFLEEKETKVAKGDIEAFIEEWKEAKPDPVPEPEPWVEEERDRAAGNPGYPPIASTSEEGRPSARRWDADGPLNQNRSSTKAGERGLKRDRLEDIPPLVTDYRDWAKMTPEEFQEDMNDCYQGGPRKPSVESSREEAFLTAPIDERGYIDFRDRYGEAAMKRFKEKKGVKIVSVTTNLDGLKPTPKSLSMTDLASVFKSLEALETVRGVNPGGPGGAFSAEVSDGLWEYLKFTVRDTRGLISLVASQVIRGEDTILYVSLDEFETAITQWVSLLEIEYENKSKDVEGLGVEIAVLNSLIEDMDKAGIF